MCQVVASGSAPAGTGHGAVRQRQAGGVGPAGRRHGLQERHHKGRSGQVAKARYRAKLQHLPDLPGQGPGRAWRLSAMRREASLMAMSGSPRRLLIMSLAYSLSLVLSGRVDNNPCFITLSAPAGRVAGSRGSARHAQQIQDAADEGQRVRRAARHVERGLEALQERAIDGR